MASVRFLSIFLCSLCLASGPASAAPEEWEQILEHSMKSAYSQSRRKAVEQVDTSTPKGLKALWRLLADTNPDLLRDPAVVQELTDMMTRWILKDPAIA